MILELIKILFTLLELIYLVGSIIVVGFLLNILRKKTLNNFFKTFGENKAIYITGIIGVPIHELSHAIVAIIFGHKITEMKLFRFNKEDSSLGYVRHNYNSQNLYHQVGNFFIGIAPILGGIVSIIFSMYVLIPDVYNEFMSHLLINISKADIINSITSSKDIIGFLFTFENLKNINFIIFMLLAICISSHIALSSEDVKGASKGLFFIFLILLILNSFGISKHIFTSLILKYNAIVISILLISIIFSLIAYILSTILVIIARK